MTMREVGPSISDDIAELVKEATRVGYKAGYRAGQEAMRERAAQLLELEYAPDKKAADRLKQIAAHIRNLKVPE